MATYVDVEIHSVSCYTAAGSRYKLDYLTVTASTTHPTWTGLGPNSGLCGRIPATNRLNSCSTACKKVAEFGR